MSEQQTPNLQLADRVKTRLSTELSLSEEDSIRCHELILAGRNQAAAWVDLVEKIICEQQGSQYDKN